MIDLKKKKSKKGGAMPGAGRPKGSMNKSTHEQKLAEQYLKNRVIKGIKPLINSQMSLAEGCSFLYMIETYKNGQKSKPILIKEQSTIEAYLNGELEKGDKEYYYIYTERPDNKALDSLLDRVFGKAPQTLRGEGEDGEIVLKIVNASNYGI